MTVKAAGLDPRQYLRDVMLRVARESDVAKLTPHAWRETSRADVEQAHRAATAYLLGE